MESHLAFSRNAANTLHPASVLYSPFAAVWSDPKSADVTPIHKRDLNNQPKTIDLSLCCLISAKSWNAAYMKHLIFLLRHIASVCPPHHRTWSAQLQQVQYYQVRDLVEVWLLVDVWHVLIIYMTKLLHSDRSRRANHYNVIQFSSEKMYFPVGTRRHFDVDFRLKSGRDVDQPRINADSTLHCRRSTDVENKRCFDVELLSMLSPREFKSIHDQV